MVTVLLMLVWSIASPTEYEFAWIMATEGACEVAPDTQATPVQQFTTRQVKKTHTVWKNKICNGRVCGRIPVTETYYVTEKVPVAQAAPVTSTQEADQYASPPDVIARALQTLRPQPHEVFLDVGSGDGRVVIAAARDYGCKAIGIEVDPERIALAQENARLAGVEDKVSFIQGDYTQVEWPAADVGYAYLFEADLKAARNKLLGLDRFVTFAHKVPDLEMFSLYQGESFLWDRDRAFVWWDGNPYYNRPCSRKNCNMCLSIQADLDEQRSHRD
jgi:hypothetical protein